MFRTTLLAVVGVLLLSGTGTLAAFDAVESATRLTFGDAHTLFVADWKAARIHAFTVPDSPGAAVQPFNLEDIQAPIARALGVGPESLRFEDLAVQPGSGLAYVALTVQDAASGARPALVRINAQGHVNVVDLERTPHTSTAITDEPVADEKFWRSIPAQSLTVTDMRFYRHRLYVAGLSNRTFASTLRVYDYPFAKRPVVSTIAMYHPVHNQVETRAPIRAMVIMQVDGRPTLVAAYTCTPLVAIPLDQLKQGAHIAAKTIGELGWGSEPRGMVTFRLKGTDYALLINSSRESDLLPLPAIAGAAGKPGLKTPIDWPVSPHEGVRAIMTPMSAAMRVDNLDDRLLLALRRDDATGHMQLVSILKGAYLRLSDFVNEYDFPDYTYPVGDRFRGFHQLERKLEGYPELAR